MNRGVALLALGVIVGASLAACSSEIRPPTLPEAGEAELAAQASVDAQRALDALLEQFPDSIAPSVERVRFIELNEWPDVTAACMGDEGFDVQSDGGGVGGGAPYGQEQPFAIAMYVCALKYPINPRSNIELNEDQIRYLYEYYTRIMTPCVQAEGYEVPPAPSLQSYIGQYGQEGMWNPYELVALATSSEEEWQFINRKCPQTPSGLYG